MLFAEWWRNVLPSSLFDKIHPDAEPEVYQIAKRAWEFAEKQQKEATK